MWVLQVMGLEKVGVFLVLAEIHCLTFYFTVSLHFRITDVCEMCTISIRHEGAYEYLREEVMSWYPYFLKRIFDQVPPNQEDLKDGPRIAQHEIFPMKSPQFSANMLSLLYKLTLLQPFLTTIYTLYFIPFYWLASTLLIASSVTLSFLLLFKVVPRTIASFALATSIQMMKDYDAIQKVVNIQK